MIDGTDESAELQRHPPIETFLSNKLFAKICVPGSPKYLPKFKAIFLDLPLAIFLP